MQRPPSQKERAAPQRGGLTGLALGVLVAALPLLVGAPLAQAGGPLEYPAGDFVVAGGETQVFVNRTLVISGNVDVQPGGTLELWNSSLLFNLSSNGSRTLTVEGGGTLRLFDLDGLAQTGFDRSLIGPFNASLRYSARFLAGANVLVKDSTLAGFGYSLAAPGLLVESDNVTFEGASLEGYEYLRVDGASPTFERCALEGDGTGSNYFFRSNAVLDNTSLSGHFVALSAAEGSTLTVTNGLVRDSVFSMAANGSTLRVAEVAVNNSSSGVFLTNGSAANFTDVDFDAGLVAFGDPASRLTASRAFTFRVFNNASEPVRNATVVVRDGGNATVLLANTGGGGSVGPVPLLAFALDGTGRADASNYTATAGKAGKNVSAVFSAQTGGPTLTLLLDANLDPTLTLVSPAPGAVLLAGLDQVFEVDALDPDATPGGLTVTWQSSLQGPLGSGTSLPLALSPGVHTVEVEARDSADGFRRLTFNVTVEVGQAETHVLSEGGVNSSATLWKTSQGSFALTASPAPTAPLLAVGDGVDLHATEGALVWAWAQVEIGYDPSALPYGTFEANLTLEHFVGGAWQPVAGAALNLSTHTLAANLSSQEGLGWFLVVATRGPNQPPEFETTPTLVAVVGRAFVFEVKASDTPGDNLTYALGQAPAWLSIDAPTGTLSGTPAPGDRGLALVTVTAADNLGASASTTLKVFVSGTADNRPPSLLNARTAPTTPVDREDVTFAVTYFDPDGDLPAFVEVVIDGTAHAMDAVDPYDINTTDGKAYTFTMALAAGPHGVTYQTSDGAPGHADVAVSGGTLSVRPDTLRTLNNWFLALFASVALTLVLVVYVRSRAPRASPGAAKPVSEERASFLEGEALKPIPPPAPLPKKPVSRQDGLAREAELRGRQARRDAGRASAKLKGEEE